MANEGFLGRTTLSGERAATDDHPLILHALPLDVTATEPMQPGTLMRRVEVKESGVTVGYAYAPWQKTDAEPPCAVVDNPCDPTGTSAEKSAICVVHGCVKTRVLKVGAATFVKPDALALEKLMQSGIFAV